MATVIETKHGFIAGDPPETVPKGHHWCDSCGGDGLEYQEDHEGEQYLTTCWSCSGCCTMPCDVVDCPEHPKPKRIQLSRKKGWRKPENTVVVARPGKWGNPFRVSDVVTRQVAVDWFRSLVTADDKVWLDGIMALTIHQRADVMAGFDGRAVYPTIHDGIIVAALAGKNLACWCPLTEPCHADVLLELANRTGADRG